MERKRNPERADRENPVWTKETFGRARKAREILPEIFGKKAAAKMLKPRGRPKTGNARTSISRRLPPDTLARWKATGPGLKTGSSFEVRDRALLWGREGHVPDVLPIKWHSGGAALGAGLLGLGDPP